MQKIKIDKKKIIILIIILILAGIFILVQRGCRKESKFEYKYEKAAVGEVIKTISVTGKLEIINPERVLCKVGGIIQKIYFDFNNEVKKGQVLLRIDSPDLDKAISQSRDNLETLRQRLLLTERQYEADKKMFQENLISSSAIKNSEINYNSLSISYKHSQMALNDLLKQKQDTVVTAPVAGTVLSRHVEENTGVGNGTLVCIIAPDLKKMRLMISIDEADIGNVKNGQKVTFSVSAYTDKTFNGMIAQVRMNPIQSGGLVTYESIVECNNNELLLKPGMTATASVLVGNKENVLRVLNQAFLVSPQKVKYDAGKKYIWRKSKSLVSKNMEFVEVKTGLVGDMYTEILGSINPDDEILVKIDETKK